MGTTITDSPPLLPPDISYKDYTRRRVFGSEQEYSISIINEKGRPFYLRSEDLLGITGLILDMLEDKKLPLLEISDPLNAFKTISSDLEFKQKYTVTKRKLEHGLLNYSDNHKNITSYEGIDELTAIDIQRIYQKTADDLYKGRDRLTDYLIEYWDFILSALSLDYKILSKHLDWVIKKNLIDEYKNKHPDRIDKCLLINLRYHEIGEGGLFHILESEGEVETILSSDEIEPYIETPPHDTRARIRGWIASINNNHILNTSNLNHNHFFIIKDIDWHWFRYQTKDKGICICPYPYNEGNKCVNFKCTLQKLDDPLDAYEGLESKLLNGKRI